MSSARYVVLTLLLAACSSGSGDDESNPTGSAGSSSTTPGDGFLSCGPGVLFHLTGDVDGETIAINEAPTLGGFRQSDAPPYSSFTLPNDGDVAAEDLVQVRLTWGEALPSGEVAAIEGWVRLPSGSPLAGETICAGPGSEMTIPLSAEKEVRGDFLFRLRELSLGPDCDQAASGELDGCWRN